MLTLISTTKNFLHVYYRVLKNLVSSILFHLFCPFTLWSSFTFSTQWLLLQRYFFVVSQIKNANLSREFPVSYKVTSPFTNIGLQETIYVTVNLIFNQICNLNLTKKELKKLFLFATSQIHFLCNSKFYNQLDGLAVGFPLSPVLANIFMGFYKSKWLNEYNLNKTNFYLRYVDNILAAFDKEQDSLNFSSFLIRSLQ